MANPTATSDTAVRTVLATTFQGAVVLATADCSTVVEYGELAPLIADLQNLQDQLGDAR